MILPRALPLATSWLHIPMQNQDGQRPLCIKDPTSLVLQGFIHAVPPKTIVNSHTQTRKLDCASTTSSGSIRQRLYGMPACLGLVCQDPSRVSTMLASPCLEHSHHTMSGFEVGVISYSV